MENISNNPEDTKSIAIDIASKLADQKVICLYGDLGSGKTTFTRYLVEALGSNHRVQSPTFVILKRYASEGRYKIINHLDLYRLSNEADLDDLDIAGLISEPDSLTIVEWPELAQKVLPEDSVKIYFKQNEDERIINVQNLN